MLAETPKQDPSGSAHAALSFATTRGLGTTASLPQAGAQHRDDDCAARDDAEASPRTLVASVLARAV
jgi:hypothetical protein